MGKPTLLTLRHVPTVTRIVVSILVLAAGFGVMSLLIATRVEAMRVDPERQAAVVPVFEAQRVVVQRPWQGYGRAEAIRRSRVPARINSVVTGIPDGLDAGVAVAEGQVLAELDEADFEQQAAADRQEVARLHAELERLDIEESRLSERIELLKKDLAIAQRQENRLRDMYEKRAANLADVERSERESLVLRRELVSANEALDGLPARRASTQASIEAARARSALATLSVERSRVTSPLAGVLSVYDLKIGENVTVGQTLAEVVDLTTIEVPVRLAAAARGTFSPGDAVRLVATSDSSRRWVGRVDRISPSDDPESRTMTAFVVVDQPEAAPNDPQTLPPGLFLSVQMDSHPSDPVLIVPRRAVRAGRLFVVEGDHLESRAVEIAYTVNGSPMDLPVEEWVVIREGAALEEADLVVAEATTLLRDGLRVEAHHLGSSGASP
ncbi:efflux RND transporter periplasmic adaptor subunit [Mucisphaera calidilacus]|uniref:Putative efflux pump membrane fusion protein n=1 Tax=Mucisphaera calidilacus TaxID=2527982 RepID=A0A518C146_9BACT|nr:efflux RND transporter periplasmic adaptor subunit [Mucisphaera calidilacus]QDU72938.1 putative efflux pump membrane fusion protein [Mucisphaera calidilacus]